MSASKRSSVAQLKQEAAQAPLELEVVLGVLQAVSGETDLHRLMASVMRLCLKHAAAARGCLIQLENDAFRVELEATTAAGVTTVNLPDSAAAADSLPLSVLRHVVRTNEAVMLPDPASDSPFFEEDGYFRQLRPNQLLCLPLGRQDRVAWLVYLEKAPASEPLTPARMALLELLVSAAATALENARLYRDLRIRETRARRLVESNIVGIVMWHADGRILDANDVFARITGYSREELISGRVRWPELTPPEWHERDARSLEEIVRTRAVPAHEREYIRKDGSRVPVLAAGAIFDDEPQEGVAFVLDLTERKRAEALAASERELQLIIDTMPAMVWSARPDGTVDYFNQSFLDYCGIPADRASSWDWSTAAHPEDRDTLVASWRRIVASEAPGQTDVRLRRHDGVYRWFLVHATPLRGDIAQIIKWYGVNTDIEDLKQAEVALRRAYDSFADAQRLSRTGNFTADIMADDHVWSAELYRIFEMDPAAKVTVQAVRERIHPDDLPAFDAAFQRSMGGVDFDQVFRIVTSAGATKFVHAAGHLVDLVASRPLFIGAIQDVTESKLAEEALNRARSELAHVARVTTLSALTASIAHEINQPLSGIITNASTCLRMLGAHPANVDGACETARRILRDGDRAAAVVARLRALFGKKEIALEPLDLSDAIREVIALMLSDLQASRVSLQTDLAEDLPRVIGDRVQLQQVVMNLMRNGSEAMAGIDDRPRRLLIRTDQDPANQVRVSVTDSGVGLTRESMEKVFDPFFTTKSGGMGIGLFISRSIIENHRGRIWVEPNDGLGVTFSFLLPCALETAAVGQR